MKNLKTIEIQILMNLRKEIIKFRQKTDDSLILKWFRSKGVASPVESKDTFMYDVNFIGSSSKPKYSGFGIIIYPEKVEYSKCFIGEMKKGRRHGHGWRIMNKSIFEGTYRRDMKHGPAKIWKISQSGQEMVFDGVYLDGQMHGYCFYKDDNHTFNGHINKGHYHGQCTIKYSNGNFFKGTMVNGEMSGKAKIMYANGDVFEGALLKNNRTGQGNYKWSAQSIMDLSSKLSITKPSKEEETMTRQGYMPQIDSHKKGILKKTFKIRH